MATGEPGEAAPHLAAQAAAEEEAAWEWGQEAGEAILGEPMAKERFPNSVLPQEPEMVPELDLELEKRPEQGLVREKHPELEKVPELLRGPEQG